MITLRPDNRLGTARFRQTPDDYPEDIEAEALTMRYEALGEVLHLIEKAKVIQRGQTYTGHRMSYDTRRGLLTAQRAEPGEKTPSGSAPPADGGRIRIIIPPKKQGQKAPEQTTGQTPGQSAGRPAESPSDRPAE
jgi:lipopolysaccharide export system protein LptA